MYANYALVDATFQTDVQLPSPNNPNRPRRACDAGPPGRPSIPTNPSASGVEGRPDPGHSAEPLQGRLRILVDPQWKYGADLVVASNQIFYGDWRQ